jgi:putative two-component system response regulator
LDKQLFLQYKSETGAQFTDGLTGLFNNGFFQLALEREQKRSERHGKPFTLALIDIDSFSLFNKKYGHIEAERTLRKIADIILNNIRESDLAARYMGDVFAIIMIHTDTFQAHAVVERVRIAVNEILNGKVTVSAGLASFPRECTTKDSLIKYATDSLYHAKMSGKNKVHFFEKETSTSEEDKSKILVVDDDQQNRKILEALLRTFDYEVLKASSGEETLSLIQRTQVDLILLDVMMPGMDGFEVCRRLKAAESTRLIPIILVTALEDKESRIKGIQSGADDFITKPLDKEELCARAKSLINLRNANNSLINIRDVLISFANAVEAKDRYTEGHIMRVASMAMALGKKMNLPEPEIAALKWGGLLHDIGKIGVPSTILNKPGSLNNEEWEVMKSHTNLGYTICLPLKPTIGPALDIIRYHHEKLDGSAYPEGLSGEDIPLIARIMAVVDIYDALITDRPYRKALRKEKALDILHQEARTGKLDRKVIKNLVELVKIEEAAEQDNEDSTHKRGGKTKIVMIVEDDYKNLKLIKALLQLENYQVLEAENAVEGIRLARQKHPDLILMDIQLPGMDGLEAIRILKQDTKLKHIPVIAISGYAMESDIKKAKGAGCDNYITKPIDKKVFSSTIAQYAK